VKSKENIFFSRTVWFIHVILCNFIPFPWENVIYLFIFSEKVAKLFNDFCILFQGSQSPVPLKDCLHPSEYDNAETLLLSRAESKLKADALGIINSSTPHANSESPVIIPFTNLGKFPKFKFTGRIQVH
jgi:hypothetical protein